MPGKFEIMRAVQKGLDSLTVELDVDVVKGDGEWTKAFKTKLCEIGRGFGYKVCARDVEKAADYGEWLYDVTWLEYELDADPLVLVDAHLVAECEWRGKTPTPGASLNYRDDVDEDFEKLLLARGGVRLMIFEGFSNRIRKCRSKEVAKRLAARVREFNGSRAEDAWLLAAWEISDKHHNGWLLRYFTIEMNAAIPFPPPN